MRCFATVLTSLASGGLLLAACDQQRADVGLYGPPRWDPSQHPDDIAFRDKNIAYARQWSGDCENEAPLTSLEDPSRNIYPGAYAAEYGVLSALECRVQENRSYLREPLVVYENPEDQALAAQGTAQLAYAVFFRADLRGLDVQGDIDVLCNKWGWELDLDYAEYRARRDLADAAAVDLITPSDLAAAKDRDAERPTCSQRLRAAGSSPTRETE